jgi:hypothetical protein
MLTVFSLAIAQNDYTVLPKSINDVETCDMLRLDLLKQVEARYTQWQNNFENLIQTGDIKPYQQYRQQKFIEAIGGFPERIPLKPQITGTLKRDRYRV